MDWVSVVVLVTALLARPAAPVSITALWVPASFQVGTTTSAVLDCVFTYTEEDRDSLELLWYHRGEPVYQAAATSKPNKIPVLKKIKKHKAPFRTNYHTRVDIFTMLTPVLSSGCRPGRRRF